MRNDPAEFTAKRQRFSPPRGCSRFTKTPESVLADASDSTIVSLSSAAEATSEPRGRKSATPAASASAATAATAGAQRRRRRRGSASSPSSSPSNPARCSGTSSSRSASPSSRSRVISRSSLQCGSQRRASATQPGSDRSGGRAEHLGGLVIAQPLRVDEQDDRSQLRRQRRQRPLEIELLLDAVRRNARGLVVESDLAAGPAAPELVQARVVDDPVEPGPERGAAPEAWQRAVGAQVGFLQDVVHRRAVAEEPVGEAPVALVVGAEQQGEGGRVAAARPGEQQLVGWPRLLAHGYQHALLDAHAGGFLRAGLHPWPENDSGPPKGGPESACRGLAATWRERGARRARARRAPRSRASARAASSATAAGTSSTRRAASCWPGGGRRG